MSSPTSNNQDPQSYVSAAIANSLRTYFSTGSGSDAQKKQKVLAAAQGIHACAENVYQTLKAQGRVDVTPSELGGAYQAGMRQLKLLLPQYFEQAYGIVVEVSQHYSATGGFAHEICRLKLKNNPPQAT